MKRGFLRLPHDLLRMWLKEGLSGTEWETLLLLAWWTIGYKDRPSCSAGTTGLSNQTARSRQNIAKAIRRLEDRGLIHKVQDPTARKATHWSVAKTRQSQRCNTEPDIEWNCSDAGTVQEPGSVSQNCDTLSQKRDTVSQNCDPRVAKTRHNIENSPIENSLIENFSETPLKVVPEGPFVDCAKNAQPTSDISKHSLRSKATLSGDSVPLPGEAPPKSKSSFPEAEGFPHPERKTLEPLPAHEALKFLADVFHDLFRGDDVLPLLDEKQKTLAAGILDKPRLRQLQILSEFSAAGQRVRKSGNCLPQHLAGPSLFVYLLKNRTSL